MGLNIGFEDIKGKIADKLLLVAFIVSIPAGLVSGIRIFTMGFKILFVIDILMAFILAAAYFTRTKSNYSIRIAFLITYVFLMGVVALNTWGLFGFGLFIMFFSIIITTVFFGLNRGLLLLGASVFVIISITICIYFNLFQFQWDFNKLSYSTYQWFSRGVFFTTFATMAVVTLGMVHKNFERINADLALSDERFRLALSSVNEVIWEINFVTGKTFISEKFWEILPFAMEEMAIDFRNWINLIHPDDVEIVNDKIQEHSRGHSSQLNLEYRIKDKFGGWHWVLTKGRIVERDANGKIIRVVGTHTDIGPRKEMERILRESEQRFRMLFFNANDAILVIKDDLIIDCNNQTYDFFKLNRDEIIGKQLPDFFHYNLLKNENPLYRYNEIKESVISGNSISAEQEFRVSDGSILDAVMSISAIEENDEVLFQVMLHDITERKLFEQNKLNAIVETEERERLKLAGDLHDDVGPLLSSLNMYLSLLNRKQTENKEEIIQNMQEILKDAISSVREISSNLSPHTLFKYGIVAAINSIVDQNKGMVNISFTHDVGDKRLPEIIEIMVFRIIKELMNNTLKYANAKNVFIDLTLFETYLSVNFEDDGVGFDIESKLNNNETGIGLINLQERLKTLKSNYTISSKVGLGFKFSMKVPI